jgi:hypothetical protein
MTVFVLIGIVSCVNEPQNMIKGGIEGLESSMPAELYGRLQAKNGILNLENSLQGTSCPYHSESKGVI